MIKYEDVQDFYDHETSLDYDETLDVGIIDPTSSLKFKVASFALWVFVVLGSIEAFRIFLHFFPALPSWCGLFILIPAGLSCGYISYAASDYWKKRWELRKKETLLLHAAIRKALWDRDFSPLFPACNPSWLTYTKENSYMWIAYAKAMQQQRARGVEPLTPLDVDSIYARAFCGKIDPYSGRPITCKADYDAYLKAYREDERSLYATLPDEECD